MNEFMIDVNELQRQVIHFETEYRKLRLQKEEFESGKDNRQKAIEEDRNKLKTAQEDLKKRLEDVQKAKKATTNPFTLNRIKDQEAELNSEQQEIDKKRERGRE